MRSGKARAGDTIRLADVIAALSQALDLTEGQPQGHCIRACYIGMRIGRAMGLEEAHLADLFYALLLKDAGCSSNAARMAELFQGDDRELKRHFKRVDGQRELSKAGYVLKNAARGQGLIERLKTIAHLARHSDAIANEMIAARCDRGSQIARDLGFSAAVSEAIFSLDEHWNGRGQAQGLAGQDIPLVSRIALLAQVCEVFWREDTADAALAVARARSGTWFDPALVEVLHDVADTAFWQELAVADQGQAILALEPVPLMIDLDDRRMDAIAAGFGRVIDAKSPFTAGHSERVSAIVSALGSRLGLDADAQRWLRRGGLLHDIGKLAVSNRILDKPGKLDDDEWAVIRSHPAVTHEILSRIGPFRRLALVAGAHHERLDGTGYPWGLSAEEIALETRIITVADIYDALVSDRPYRAGMSDADALAILHKQVGTALDPACVEALEQILASPEQLERDAVVSLQLTQP